MGLRGTPSQRQKRIGQELRKLREAAGLTTSEAGRRVGLGQAHLSHIEAARTACPERRLRALVDAYGCLNEPVVDALVALSAGNGRGWWSEYSDVVDERGRDLAELESTATAHQSFQWLYVPGLFQTESYMRELFTSRNPDASSETIDRHVGFRRHRQHVVTNGPARSCHAVIHESAFHMRFVSRQTMRDQLAHLVELSQLPQVTIQLLPFKAESQPVTPGAPFTIYEAGLPELRTVHVEQPITPMFLSDESHITQFTEDFERLSKVSLAPLRQSQQLEGGSLELVQHLRYIL